jgi:hypothetical protein
MIPSILQEKLSSPILKIQNKASSPRERQIYSIVVRIVLLIGITSSTVIFLLLSLVLFFLLFPQIVESLFIHILVIILFIIKFESALITDPNFLREFCDLYGLFTVAHFHPIIA